MGTQRSIYTPFTVFLLYVLTGCRRIASPVRDAATTSFYAAQSIRKCVWSDLEENGVVSYLLPLLVSAGIMHFARRIVKLDARSACPDEVMQQRHGYQRQDTEDPGMVTICKDERKYYTRIRS